MRTKFNLFNFKPTDTKREHDFIISCTIKWKKIVSCNLFYEAKLHMNISRHNVRIKCLKTENIHQKSTFDVACPKIN